jgi:hypothetical protein
MFRAAHLMRERWGLDVNMQLLRLGLLGTMLPNGHHTYHEVMRAAAMFDRYHNNRYRLQYVRGFGRYRYLLPLTTSELRTNVALEGLFPDEHVYLDAEGAPSAAKRRAQSPPQDEPPAARQRERSDRVDGG